MSSPRRTKIISTLGPSTSDLATIKKLIETGVNVFRLNFSHGKADDHRQRAVYIREAAESLQTEVAIMADLQGPKIRISRFKNDKVMLAVGQTFTFDSDLDSEAGDETQVGIDYKTLPQEVGKGDRLLLDDGRVEMTVDKVQGNKIICTVDVGGALSNNKGINKQGGGLAAEALTDKDKEDLITAVDMGSDYIAISFPRSAADMNYARKLLHEANGTCGLVAKIERAEAVEEGVIDEIIKASDAVMVARGDLGVEIGDAELPAAQKYIIQRARALDKAVITATQMMESMIENNIPTRAEVFDVANAVLDGTDAVMTSAETATGKHPLEVVAAMDRVCHGTEQQPLAKMSGHRVECHFDRIDETIAMSAMYAANHLNIKAIIALTESGHTPLLMSRIRSGIPVYALSRSQQARRKMCMYRGVYPLAFDPRGMKAPEAYQAAMKTVLAKGLIAKGDRILVTGGDEVGVGGQTNVLKILEVE
tara:strand:+ start:70252 stop:71688 length:1437 start_codon:yes stop_codon:yes gene_type:complete